MLRCVVFDLETVLTPEAPDVVLEVMRRCFSRYRLGAVSTSADGNVAVKSGLELSDWGRHIEVVVTPSEVEGAAAYRAVCSAMGAQVASSIFITSRADAVDDAARAGLSVLWVGPDAPDGVATVDHLEWVPQALRDWPPT